MLGVFHSSGILGFQQDQAKAALHYFFAVAARNKKEEGGVGTTSARGKGKGQAGKSGNHHADHHDFGQRWEQEGVSGPGAHIGGKNAHSGALMALATRYLANDLGGLGAGKRD